MERLKWAVRVCAIAIGVSANGAMSQIRTPSHNSRVLFLQRFVADEDNGQCGFGQSLFKTPFGLWSAPIYINTDGRPGGCLQSFAIVDPDDELAGWSLKIDFDFYGTERQCDITGYREVPRSQSAEEAVWTKPYRIDTDEREGGCSLEFSIQGRLEVVLDLEVRADGITDQCPDRGRFTASVSQSVKIRIKTDGRAGGCYLRFRLRADGR
jgi:hypothetical protein